MTPFVREAATRDLDRVAALWTSITHHHQSLDPVFQMRPHAEDQIRALLLTLYRDPEARIFVYDDQGDILGICIVRIDHSPPIMRETGRAEITDLGVRESVRRKGIGTRLLEEALAWVQTSGIQRVEIQVAKGNAAGQLFWRARGFGDLMDVLHKRL
ncbi:MAG: GNAT family N-acetyltransferase [Myxococcota bacterium]|nr:GNAT family N-acetyltransferase [Myxococcota bacterium]